MTRAIRIEIVWDDGSRHSWTPDDDAWTLRLLDPSFAATLPRVTGYDAQEIGHVVTRAVEEAGRA
jgi:plasmid replication initiation protein